MSWSFPDYPENWDEIRHVVYRRDNYTCQRCGARGGRYGDAVLHCAHKVSLSKGGTNDYSNLETVCEECHIKEHPHLLNSPVFRQRHLNLQKDGLTQIRWPITDYKKHCKE